jgi:hypothetical protein
LKLASFPTNPLLANISRVSAGHHGHREKKDYERRKGVAIITKLDEVEMRGMHGDKTNDHKSGLIYKSCSRV